MNHFTFANALIGIEITAIGISATVLGKTPVFFALFSILTVIIWLSYMDHIASIHRIAFYVGTQLRGRMQDVIEQPSLEWEYWLRKLRSTGVTMTSQRMAVAERGREPRLGLTYPSLFYGGTAASLLLYFIYRTVIDDVMINLLVWPIAVITCALLVFATAQSMRLGALMRQIDSCLLESEGNFRSDTDA
jgi:hypothetical protein